MGYYTLLLDSFWRKTTFKNEGNEVAQFQLRGTLKDSQIPFQPCLPVVSGTCSTRFDTSTLAGYF